MIMLKKFSLTIVAIFVLFLSACGGTTDPLEKTDMEIVYEVKDELSFDNYELTDDITIPFSDEEGVTLSWTSSLPSYLDIDGSVNRPDATVGDKDVSLTVVITLNDAVVTRSFEFTVLATEANTELDTRYTDELTLNVSYENSNFIDDGVGEVTLVSCVDGDTAVFTEGSGTFSVRFLGINTPESTYKFEPWGKPASDFTCSKLENATTIVLEADPNNERTDGNERYLAWVWYDGRLLNLELIEEAYTKSTGLSGLKYESVFYEADFKTMPTGRRVWGETDDTFDYTLDGVQITIEELVTNQEEYVGTKVVVRGVITRVLDGHPYIQQDGYGIYVYTGFDYTEKLAVGNYVLIQSLVLTYYPNAEEGAAQLTNFNARNTIVLEEDVVVPPTTVTIDGLSRDSIGSLVQLNGLTVVSIYENTFDDAFTITAEDSSGNRITIRRDAAASEDLTADLFTVGTTFDVVAPLGRYDSNYQLMLISLEDVTFTSNE
jgi:micrococcal nuclease